MWLSSIAYLKNNCVFSYYFTPHFFLLWLHSHPLVDIRACTHWKSFTFIIVFFYTKYWTGHQYFHKTGVILLEKKINTRLAEIKIIVFKYALLSGGVTMWPNLWPVYPLFHCLVILLDICKVVGRPYIFVTKCMGGSRGWGTGGPDPPWKITKI